VDAGQRSLGTAHDVPQVRQYDGGTSVRQGAGRSSVAMFAQTVPGDGIHQERQFLRGFAPVAAEVDGPGVLLDYGRSQRRSTVPGDHFPMHGQYSITH